MDSLTRIVGERGAAQPSAPAVMGEMDLGGCYLGTTSPASLVCGFQPATETRCASVHHASIRCCLRFHGRFLGTSCGLSRRYSRSLRRTRTQGRKLDLGAPARHSECSETLR